MHEQYNVAEMYFENYSINRIFHQQVIIVQVIHNLWCIAGGKPERQNNENLLYWHI